MSFIVQYPNKIYLTIRNLDTEKTPIRPFTISYNHINGPPIASIWTNSMQLAIPQDMQTLLNDTETDNNISEYVEEKNEYNSITIKIIIIIGVVIIKVLILYCIKAIK